MINLLFQHVANRPFGPTRKERKRKKGKTDRRKKHGGNRRKAEWKAVQTKKRTKSFVGFLKTKEVRVLGFKAFCWFSQNQGG